MQEFATTVVGNLVTDPRMRVMPSGAQVCSFRIAVTPRFRRPGSGEWCEGASMSVAVSCWRALAENVTASLHRGDRVVVIGRMRQRGYLSPAGEERLLWEVEADLVAPDLGRQTADVHHPPRLPGGLIEGGAPAGRG